MPVVLKFQSTGKIPGNGEPVPLQGPSLTVGRGPENDLVLPDPDRVMSKRHCAIEDHNGNVVVVDFSTNGTFLNYGKLALGPTPTPLNDGDILSIGPYELLVSIASEELQDQFAAPLEDGPVSHGIADRAPSAADLLDAPGDGGDFLDDLLSGRDQPVGPGGVEREEDGEDGLLPPLGADDPLLPAEPEAHVDPFAVEGASFGMHSPAGQDSFASPQPTSAAIPDDWDFADDLAPGGGTSDDPFGTPTPPAQTTAGAGAGAAAFIPDDLDIDDVTTPPTDIDPAPAPVAVPRPEPARVQMQQAPPTAPVAPTTAPPAPVAPAAAGGDAAARAFLAALGADHVQVADQDLVPTMTRLGQILQTMITGVREILMTRTSIKSEFRIQQTVVRMGDNNALKFSISNEQAISAMVLPKARGYLDAVEAAEESMQDIKVHEVAMMAGMQAAIGGVLSKLDPAKLQEMIDKSGSRSMLKSRGTQYWETYKTMYAEISDQAESDFYDLFTHEFARAYQEQLDKLK